MNSYQDHNFTNSNYTNLYYERLYSLDIDFEFMSIETSFGDTTIISTGIQGNTPLILVHDLSSCAPIALSQHLYLTNYFKVFAVDVLVEDNSHKNAEMNLKYDDYGKWMYEILSRLQLVNATVFGISFGGYIALKSLIYNTDRISYGILINPSGLLKQSRSKWFNPCRMFKYLFTKNARKSSYSVPMISKKKLSNIKTPISVVLNANNSAQEVKTLKQIVKDNISTIDEVVDIQSQDMHQEYATIEKFIKEKFKNK